MKKLALVLFLVAGCKDENPIVPDGPPMQEVDAAVVQPPTYVQVEHLARPGINEALLLTNDFNAGYNATAPSFAGAPPAAVTAITGEAKTVLKALYLGVCLLDGALNLTPSTGLKPAGIQCHAVGAAIWTENTLAGVTLTPESKTAAQAYADKVFSQFIPDVMRIDTSAPSGYLTLCGDANSVPLLCGGRLLNEDVIDITYNYLLAGAAVPAKGSYNQVTALVSDGVNFSSDDAKNSGNAIASTGISNANQYHPDVTSTFPYSAAPF
ncbi:MAG TPA: DUF4331 family protein [Kofleriaceae bacterium]|nr:DUF4331 family protein [Kofleriaceae bacterium]